MQASTSNKPTNGCVSPTYDINSRLMRPYYGVEGNEERVLIMSIEKSTAKEAELQATRPGAIRSTEADAETMTRLEVLSLELEDDNLGGDPYNRTGSFCQLDLQDRE